MDSINLQSSDILGRPQKFETIFHYFSHYLVFGVKEKWKIPSKNLEVFSEYPNFDLALLFYY